MQGTITYYQVTSRESAQALMESDNPALRGGEQAINSGAYYPETVIQFESSASFIPDTSMDDTSLHDIAKKVLDRDQALYQMLRWWEFWKK